MKKGIKQLKIRKLMNLAIILVISLVCLTSNVHAKTYRVSNNGSTASLFVPNGTVNISFGNNYSNASGQGMTQIRLKLLLDDTNDNYNVLEAGSYLLDYYIVSNSLDTDLANCKDYNSDYRFIDLTTGNSISSSSSIKSQCINSFYTKVSGVNAIHYLIQFTITNTASYPFITKELDFYNNLWHGLGFVQGGATWNVTLGNLSDYDSSIVTSFNNEANSQTQINQNQTIIDQNQQQIQQDKAQHDEFMDSDIPDEDKELPDDSKYQDYTDTENDLKDKVNEADMSVISIGINANSSNFIWDTLTRLIQSNSIVFGMFIAILSIGIIKLALGR